MKKVQFFILVEAVLFTLAMIQILSQNFPRFIIILVLFLLALRYYWEDESGNFFLTAAAVVLFLVMMLNPYVILGVLFAVIYMLINYFAQIRTEGYYQRIKFDSSAIKPRRERMKWIGNSQYGGPNTNYVFDDINITRLFGNDLIDLDEAVLSGRNNVVIIRKSIGNTKVIVPVDVEVDLMVTSLYGQVIFLNQAPAKLHNEVIKLRTEDFETAHKTVKLVLNVFLGDVEVIRI